MRAHLTASAAALLASALLLTGCSSARPESADTVDGPAVTSTAAPDADESQETPEPVVEAADLTQAQIDAALLTQADMPAGWTQDAPGADAQTPLSDEGEDLAVYEPAVCKDLLNSLGDTAAVDPVAEGEVSFSTADYAVFAQSIQTWDKTFDQGKLDELVASMSACSNVVQTDPDGTVTTSTISALEMPNYGDRTFAARIAASTPIEGLGDLTFTIDFVTVATGTTSVSFVAGGFEPVDPAALQALITTAMAKVAAV